MIKLSRKQIEIKDFSFYINNLWSAFTLMDSKEEIRLLSRDLFTHTEYKMFAKRLEIARRLIAKQSYEDIIKALNVTPNTITKISNILSESGEGLRIVDKKLGALEEKFEKKRVYNQKLLERRVRNKPAAETFLPDLLKTGISSAVNHLKKARKKASAYHS